MPNTHTKITLTPFAIREIYVRTTMRYHYLHVRMSKSKTNKQLKNGRTQSATVQRLGLS